MIKKKKNFYHNFYSKLSDQLIRSSLKKLLNITVFWGADLAHWVEQCNPLAASLKHRPRFDSVLTPVSLPPGLSPSFPVLSWRSYQITAKKASKNILKYYTHS